MSSKSEILKAEISTPGSRKNTDSVRSLGQRAPGSQNVILCQKRGSARAAYISEGSPSRVQCFYVSVSISIDNCLIFGRRFARETPPVGGSFRQAYSRNTFLHSPKSAKIR